MIWRIQRVALVLAAFLTIGTGQAVDLGPDLSVTAHASDVWLYRSSGTVKGQLYWANGTIVWTRSSWLVIDTPWNDDQTQRLLAWMKGEKDAPVSLVVITHSHQDRAGGMKLLKERGVPTLSHALTADRLVKEGYPRPDQTLTDSRTMKLGEVAFEVYFPGAGHAPDNIVVWFPDRQLLHGGCFIKGGGSTTIGNVSDADLVEWPRSLDRLKARYPGITSLIPGHQDVGGPELIELTRRLIPPPAPAKTP